MNGIWGYGLSMMTLPGYSDRRSLAPYMWKQGPSASTNAFLRAVPKGVWFSPVVTKQGIGFCTGKYADGRPKDKINKPSIVCNPKNAKEPIEWQADYFSSCLLMPKKTFVRRLKKFVLLNRWLVKNSMRDKNNAREQPYLEQWPFIAAAMCEAGGFSNVSKHAMIIRLQDLGLLVNKTGKKMDWNSILVDE